MDRNLTECTLDRFGEADNPCGEVALPRAKTPEERLRAENPGLQELWEQYQTMLKLLTPADTKKSQSASEEMLEQLKKIFKG